ncbi:diaminopimelate decarboxylase family protein [Streptomyces sp. NBC_01716]|uniref:diaminopimelate decarboxylase family protein n=1 Tax=Streptomyces sp. NBC_01716 TaxID=2975917 RepID=UPI002E34306D|nr:hypothetical protein [Streptomyces sp. NBC_01716]
MREDADTPLRGLSREQLRRIDEVVPYLSYADGLLHAFGAPATELWPGDHPRIVFFPERAVSNYRNLQGAFSRHFGSDALVYFALKSCYVPAIAQALHAAGAGAEIMSAFEWRLALRYGFAPDTVVANAVRRNEEFRETVLSAGARVIGVDGLEELEAVCATARRLGVRPDVTVRVSPFETDTFFGGSSKLGTPAKEAGALLEAALRSPDLGTVGVHSHQLRKCVDPQRFGTLVRALGDLAADASTDRRRVAIVNLGGGLESRHVMEQQGVDCDDFAGVARDALSGMRPGFRLILEPGRHLVSDAAVAFTRVLGTKQTADAHWAITEIGTNVLVPFPDRAYRPVPLTWNAGDTWQTYHLSDAIAAPNLICGNAPLPESVDRSGLAMLDCGAYTTVYSELWGCDLPDVAVFDGGRTRRVFGPAEREGMFMNLYGGDTEAATSLSADEAEVVK